MIDPVMNLGAVSLAYRESGHGDPMVLVHANLSDLRSWEPLEPLVARHFRVINYSRRYAHPNQPIGDGSDDAFGPHVDDLVALIETLRLGRVHLVGNSSGAFICLLAAQKRPDLVRTLTLEEPPVISLFLRSLPPKLGEVVKLLCSSPLALLALLKFGAGAIGPAIKAFEKDKDDEALEMFSRGVLGDMTYEKLVAARKKQMTDNIKPHRAALLGSGLPVFTETDAAAIRVPTQLVCGSNTPGFQRRINRRLAELIPGARSVCVPESSHFVHEDNPQAVARAVLEFCREH